MLSVPLTVSVAAVSVVALIVFVTLIVVVVELRLNLIVAARVVALTYRYDHRICSQRAQVDVRYFRIETPLTAGARGSRQDRISASSEAFSVSPLDGSVAVTGIFNLK